MRFAMGPKGVLVLLGACLALEWQVMRMLPVLERHDARQHALASEAKERTESLKDIYSRMGTEDAARLARLEEAAAKAQVERAKAARNDILDAHVPVIWASLVLHLTFMAAVVLMLSALLPPGIPGPVFAGLGLSVAPIAGLCVLRVYGVVSGGVWADFFGSAFLAALLSAAVFLAEDRRPGLRRVRDAASRVWPFLLTPWVFLLTACLGLPFGWTTMVYLAATSILVAVEYELAAMKAALPDRVFYVTSPREVPQR